MALLDGSLWDTEHPHYGLQACSKNHNGQGHILGQTRPARTHLCTETQEACRHSEGLRPPPGPQAPVVVHPAEASWTLAFSGSEPPPAAPCKEHTEVQPAALNSL